MQLYPAIRSFALNVWGVTLIAFTLNGCSDKAAVAPAAIRAVKVETVQAGQGDEVLYSGIVRQHQRARLAFDASGTLTRLDVDVGDAVRQGQVLAALDGQPAMLRLKKAQAAAGSTAASVAERARNEQRQQRLFAAGSVAQSVVDAAQVSLQQALAEQHRAQSDVVLARRDVDKGQLVAPFSGYVVARQVDNHAELTAGQTVLDIESTAEPQVIAALPVEQAERLRPGDKAAAYSASDSSRAFELVLERVSPSAESGLVKTCIFRLIDPSSTLASGLSVRVQLDSPDQPQLSVPVQALWMGLGSNNAQVFIYQMKGTVAVRSVSIDAIKNGRALIKDGLSMGEKVVTAGAAFLVDGQTVSLFQPTTRLGVGGAQ
jgi:RND family efflux transporter MFP subunit